MAGILMEALQRLPSELTLLSSGSSDDGMLLPIMEDERSFFNEGGPAMDQGWIDNSFGKLPLPPEDTSGGPMGTDTVPAYLTEGEFVIDRDSARQFGPMLEQINNWEPQLGSDEFFLNEMDNLINEFTGAK